MARIERLRIHPVKALDATDVDTVRVTEGGTLAGDREFALFDPDGEPINGKRTPLVHELDTELDGDKLTVRPPDGESLRFDLGSEREAAAEWFGEFFDEDVTVRRNAELGYVDRRESGPSVISTATLEEVATWFADLSVESVRRRMRANVEVSGVPAFWEDRFVGADAPTFTAGDVRFEGVEPCGRCVVPTRDPDTGEPTPEFKERFVQKREATFPEWADPDAFDHYYSLMLIARVPETDRGEVLSVGDSVEVSA